MLPAWWHRGEGSPAAGVGRSLRRLYDRSPALQTCGRSSCCVQSSPVPGVCSVWLVVAVTRVEARRLLLASWSSTPLSLRCCWLTICEAFTYIVYVSYKSNSLYVSFSFLLLNCRSFPSSLVVICFVFVFLSGCLRGFKFNEIKIHSMSRSLIHSLFHGWLTDWLIGLIHSF